MSESALANLQTYPLYNMITEHVNTKAGKEISREGLHNSFEKNLREQNKDNETLPGGIASTGDVTHEPHVYKRRKPQDSPTDLDHVTPSRYIRIYAKQQVSHNC